MHGIDGLCRPLDGGLKSERAVDELEVVVDGLGNSDDCDLEAVLSNLVRYVQGSALGSVTADDVHLVDSQLLDGIDDFLDLVTASA